MERKHFVINIDDEFLKKMTSLRYFLNKRYDGDVLKECVERVYLTFDKKTVKHVNKVRNIDNINNIININFVKTNDVDEGFMSIFDIMAALKLKTSTNKLASILKNLGFENKRTAKARVWLIKKK